jgi:hypothetical protein
MKFVHVETRPSGSRVELQSRNRTYMAIVMPDGEIIRLDVEYPYSAGRYWRVDRFSRRGIPRRVQDAVRKALQH